MRNNQEGHFTDSVVSRLIVRAEGSIRNGKHIRFEWI